MMPGECLGKLRDLEFGEALQLLESVLSRLREVVAANERQECAALWHRLMREAIFNEREACAEIADNHPAHCGIHDKIAEAIRARGQK